MVMKLFGQANTQNQNINNLMLMGTGVGGSGHINQTAGSSGLPFMGLEEYKDLRIRHHWEFKGLGRIFILSP